MKMATHAIYKAIHVTDFQRAHKIHIHKCSFVVSSDRFDLLQILGKAIVKWQISKEFPYDLRRTLSANRECPQSLMATGTRPVTSGDMTGLFIIFACTVVLAMSLGIAKNFGKPLTTSKRNDGYVHAQGDRLQL